jgi:hypothetical protein
MFKSFLKYLSKARDGNDPLILHQNIIRKWSEEEVYTLKQLGVLRQASPANSIICPGCEEYCHETVETRLGQDGKSVERFVRCGVRSTDHVIQIEPADLEQWQIDINRFVSLLASALDIGAPPIEIIPRQAFYLGILSINRKRRAAIFVVNNETVAAATNQRFFEQYISPFFLVAGDVSGPAKKGHRQEISLRQVLLESTKGISIDFEGVKSFLSTKGAARRDVIPFDVATTTKWHEVIISFANEHTVQIKVGAKIEHRSFDEMGFSDGRKSESNPSGLWGEFRGLASSNGEITFQDSAGTFSEPKITKKSVSLIREQLKAVFPGIASDPFHPYTQVNGYKTRFILNTLPSFK